MPGYDFFKTRSDMDYDPEFRFEELELPQEPEYAEPTVSETWDGSAGRYVTQVTFMSGSHYYVTPYQSDYAIFGPSDFFREVATLQAGVDFLLDYEHWGW